MGLFGLQTIVSAVPAFAQPLTGLPEPGVMISPSQPFTPAILRGLVVYPDNPLRFDFLVDTGDDALTGEALKDETAKLVKYFLAALTVPENELWVNLSPYESDRVVPEGLGMTELGRDLLAQDYVLKQMVASLMSPDERLGSDFWKRVYEKASELYGTTDIPIDTFNKVWIVPDRAVVYESPHGAFVGERHLKVMLEDDYLAFHDNMKRSQPPATDREPVNKLTSDSVREVLIPELEKEVNEGENFANLRQIVNSMILAAWYKKRLRDSLLGQVYVDQNKVTGVDLDDPTMKDQIYAQYLQAFQLGVFNYIKEDVDVNLGEPVSRKYFSGGIVGDVSVQDLEIRPVEEAPSPVVSLESRGGDLQQAPVELVENLRGKAHRADLRRFRNLILSSAAALGLCVGCSVSDETLPTNTPGNTDAAAVVQNDTAPTPEQKHYWMDLIEEGEYEDVFRRAGEFIHEPFAFDVLKSALESHPSDPFHNSSMAAVDYFRNYSSHPRALDIVQPAIDYGNASQVYANFSRFLETPLGREVIRHAVYAHPSLALAQLNPLDVYELRTQPDGIKNFENYLRDSADPVLKLIGTIAEGAYPWGVKERMGVLIQSILDGRISLADAARIGQGPREGPFFRELVTLKSTGHPVGLQSVNEHLDALSSTIVNNIARYSHSPQTLSETSQFVSSLSFQEIYQLFSSLRHALPQNAFDVLYPQFRKELQEARDRKKAVLPTDNWKKDFRRLLRTLAFFDRLPDFLSFFDAATIQSFFPEIDIRDFDDEEGKDYRLRNAIVKFIMAEHLSQTARPGSPEKRNYIQLVQQAKQEIDDYPQTTQLESGLSSFLSIANGFQAQPFARAKIQSVVATVAEENPSYARFFGNSDRWIDYDYGVEYFILAARQNPVDALKALKEKDTVLRVLERSNDPVAQTLVTITSLSIPQDDKSRLALLTHDLVHQHLTLEQAVELLKKPFDLRARVLNIKNQPEAMGLLAIDEFLKNFYLKLVEQINALHGQPDAFHSIDGASSVDLYTLIVEGEQEIYTSTFNEVFNRLMAQMQNEHITGDQLLRTVDFHKFRSFLKLSAEFGRLDHFLARMDVPSADALLRKLIVDLEKEEKFLNQTIVVAEVFHVVKKKELLRQLQTYVENELARVRNEEHSNGMIIYGILYGMFAQKAVINDQWFAEMSEQLGLPDLSQLDVNSLFNEKGVNVQRHFFYNDEDGQWSFKQFLRDYQNNPQWTIASKEDYIHLTSQAGQRSIEIFANLPEKETAGEDAINRIFTERGISPKIIVHRGHRFHAPETVTKILKDVVLVILGSCGGSNLVKGVVDQGPLYIVATKGTGSNAVNNPLLALLNENTLEETTIDWENFWKTLRRRTNSSDFEKYVRPDQNIGVLVNMAYKKAVQDSRLSQIASRPAAPNQDGLPAANDTVGGIDMDSLFLNLQIKRDGEGIPLPAAQQAISSMHISGFSPVILNIVPVEPAFFDGTFAK